MKKIFSFILLLLCLCSMVLATNSLESQNFYSGWQNRETGAGYTSISMSFPNVSFMQSVNYGSNFQPLIADLDHDGTNDIVITSGTYLFAFNDIANSLFIKYQFVMPVAPSYQPALIEDRDTGQVLVAIPGSSVLRFYTLNSTGWKLERSYNVTKRNMTFSSGILCTSQLPGSVGDACFWSANTKRWAEYYYKTNTSASFQLPGYSSGSASPQSPVLSPNFNGLKAALAIGTKMFIVNPLALTQSTSFSIGIAPINYFFNNVDAGGFDELVVFAGPMGSCLRSYDSAGGVLYDYTDFDSQCGSLTSTNSFAVVGGIGHSFLYNHNPVYGYFSQLAVADLNNGYLYIFNGSVSHSYTKRIRMPNIVKGSQGYSNLLAVDTDNDGYEEIITPYIIIDPRDNTFVNYSELKPAWAGPFAVGYTDDTGNARIVGSSGTSGKSWISGNNIVYSGLSPITGGNGSLIKNTRGLDITPGLVVCANSVVTFSAFDCANVSDSCNYWNPHDNGTSEYLYTSCGKSLLPLTAGLPNPYGPIVQCNYTTPGTYKFKVYGTIHNQNTNPKVSWDMTIQVLAANDSIPGVTCNYYPIVGVPEIVGHNDSKDQQQKTQLEEIFTLRGLIPQFLAGMIIMGLGIFLFVAIGAENPHLSNAFLTSACLIFEFFLFILCIWIGLIEAWVLVVFLIFAAAGIALSIFLTGKSGTLGR